MNYIPEDKFNEIVNKYLPRLRCDRTKAPVDYEEMALWIDELSYIKARLQSEASFAETELKRITANTYIQIKGNPAKYGLPDKLSETALKVVLDGADEVVQAKTVLRECTFRFDRIAGMLSAMYVKKDFVAICEKNY